jgi:hypothetical protein
VLAAHACAGKARELDDIRSARMAARRNKFMPARLMLPNSPLAISPAYR